MTTPCTWSPVGAAGEEADSHLGDGHGVGGVDALHGAAEAWALAREVHVEVGTARHGLPALGGHGCTIMAAWTPSKTPRSSRGSPAAALLGRRSDHPEREAELVGERGETKARPDRTGGDDVVAAGVTDVGQGVVLGAHRYHEGPRPEPA